MKKFLVKLTALLAFTQITYASLLPDTPDKPLTQAVDLNKWMIEFFLHEKTFVPLSSSTLSGYSLERLQNVTAKLKETGLWHKMTQNQCGWIDTFMGIMRDYPLDLLGISVDWVKETGAWESNGAYSLMKFFEAVNHCPNPRRDEILKWLTTNFTVEGLDLYGMPELIGTLQRYPDDKFQPTLDWLVEKGAIRKCTKYIDVNKLFLFLGQKFGRERFHKIFGIMEETGIWEKCNTSESFISLHYIVDRYSKKRIRVVIHNLKETGLWDRCKEARDLRDVLERLREYNDEQFVNHMAWVKEAGVWDAKRVRENDEEEPQTPTASEICDLLSIVKACKPEASIIILPWMRDSQIMDKCYDVYHFNELLKMCQRYDTHHIVSPLAWIKDSGVLLGLERGSEQLLVKTVWSFQDRIISAEKWMRESGAWDMCVKTRTLVYLMTVLNEYTETRLIEVGNWMKESGLLSKCDGETLSLTMESLNYCSLSFLQRSEGWLKKLGIWETSTDKELSLRIAGIKKKQNQTFWVESMDKLMDQYEQWCNLNCSLTIREFIIQNL